MAAVKKGDNVLIAARVVDAYSDTGRIRITPLDASGLPAGKAVYLAAGVAVLPPKAARAAGAVSVQDIHTEITKLNEALDHIQNDREAARLGNELHGKLSKLARKVEAYRDSAGADPEWASHVTSRLGDLTNRVLIEIFRFSPTEAAEVQLVGGEQDATPPLPIIYVDCSYSLSGDQKLTCRAWSWAEAFQKRGCEIWGFNDSALLKITSTDDIRNMGGGGNLDSAVKHADGRPAILISDGRGVMLERRLVAATTTNSKLPENFLMVDVIKTPEPSRALIDNATATTLPEPFTPDTPSKTSIPMENAMSTTPRPILDVNVTALDGYSGVDVAAVKLSVVALGRTLEVEGSAKRQHDDEPNEEIGRLLALGRALRHAGRQFEDEGRALSEAACTQHVHPDTVAAINGSNESDGPAPYVERSRHDKHVEHLNGLIERLQADAIAADERLAAQEILLAKQAEALAAKPKPRTRKAAATKAPAKPRTRTTAAAKRPPAK